MKFCYLLGILEKSVEAPNIGSNLFLGEIFKRIQIKSGSYCLAIGDAIQKLKQ